MITGELKKQVDDVWNTFWSGGISNPLSVLEQITYLLFLRQLDIQQTNVDRKIAVGVPVDPSEHIFSREQQHLRWRQIVELGDATAMHDLVSGDAFDFIRELGGSGMREHMKGATFGINSPATLKLVMDKLDEIDLRGKDLSGDLYEYMLSKLMTSGANGQFRTPSHIIDLIVALMEPTFEDRIIDPACGTAGFLVGAAEWAKGAEQGSGKAFMTKANREHYEQDMFHGFDFDATMVRIAAMNMFMHGIDEPNIAYRDSLLPLPDPSEAETYSLVLANPPFAGSTAADLDPKLEKVVGAKTKKTELLFIARFLDLLQVGGRAAVIVPEGVLFGSTKAHKSLRKTLIEKHDLQAVVKLPSGTFKPYSGVSTAILCFTKTGSGGTKDVWFYDVRADGFSLDDKRTPLLDANLLGPVPSTELADDHGLEQPITLTDEELAKNNLPDVLARFKARRSSERKRERKEQSFTVPVAEIAGADYDLSINRYKEITFEAEETRDPLETIAEIEALDEQILAALSALKEELQ